MKILAYCPLPIDMFENRYAMKVNVVEEFRVRAMITQDFSVCSVDSESNSQAMTV